ncbi:hypothetical protein [Methylococcus geothermalis]|uniref:Uncharacterized protein n=1 Tax=Methylococcus geothermalis TaxID=2681310 RepID=A0A858Q8Q5_9GAMM|nr:hypothetical protein [Methylococcus geothermalis]QJD30181.1 hypothetical protein GNH96_09500 [Methylococcus geothermalis]
MSSVYIPYLLAVRRLRARLDATARELAGWVFLGPELGGLAAFVRADVLDDPPRFYFPLAVDDPGADYLGDLHYVWFREEDIEAFEPGCRFVAGGDLIRRWGKALGEDVQDFIQARCDEGVLEVIYPNAAAVSWGVGGAVRETALFFADQVWEVEARHGLGDGEGAGEALGADEDALAVEVIEEGNAPWFVVKRQRDGWVEVLKRLAWAVHLERGQAVDWVEAWVRLVRDPPKGLGIEVKEGGRAVVMKGEKELRKDGFKRRWGRYVKGVKHI